MDGQLGPPVLFEQDVVAVYLVLILGAAGSFGVNEHNAVTVAFFEPEDEIGLEEFTLKRCMYQYLPSHWEQALHLGSLLATENPRRTTALSNH